MILPSPQGHHDRPKSLPTIKEGSRASDTIKEPSRKEEGKPANLEKGQQLDPLSHD